MLRFLFNLLITLLLVMVITVGSVIVYLLPGLPSTAALKDVRLQVPLKVYTRDNSVIAEFGEKRRSPIRLADAPALLVKAVLATEDDRFYQHPGVDWQAILRAAIQLARTGEKTQGGSTITMQVARNFFLTPEKTFLRKVNEILLALKIEHSLTKTEILELYLNKIYLGQRAYGVAAAAEVYYGAALNDLSLAQLAMIAGLPKAPSTQNPISAPNKALERRNYVVGRMLERGYIARREYESAVAEPDKATLHGRPLGVDAPYVAEMVRAQIVERYGEEAYEAGYRVVTTISDRLQRAANEALHATLIEYDRRHGYRGPEHHDPLHENAAEQQWTELLRGYAPVGGLVPGLVVQLGEAAVTAYTPSAGLVKIEWSELAWARRYLDENRRGAAPGRPADILKPGDVIRLQATGDGGWRLAQVPEVEGALVALNPVDGAVLALVGGFDFWRSKFNRVTQGRRQPGSGFKPFIYSAALESGYTAASIINDAPLVFVEPGLDKVWRPENYTRTYHGPTRLRDALAFSRNLVSIRLLQAIGVDSALRHAARFGFDAEQLPRNLSLSLGTGSVTPLELATGYAIFANGGFRVGPYFVERILADSGEIMTQSNPATACAECERGVESGASGEEAETLPPANPAKRAFSPQNTWIMNSMLRDVVQIGTAKAARELNRGDLAGKTGTTNDQKDAWFSGFNSRIVASVWVGFDQTRPLGKNETGARAALPMWIRFMKTALDGMPESIMAEPDGLVMVRIDPDTGMLTDAGNPRAIFEVFPAESVPNPNSAPPGTDSGAPIPEQLF